MSTCPIYQKRGDQLVPVLVIDEAPSSDPSAAGHLVDSNGIASVVQELREEISELQPDVPTIVESVDSITEEDHDGFYWAFDETGAHRVPESNANFPVGSIVYTAMKAAPHGFLICDGSEVGRTTYPDLFTAIGTTYGAGDGTTTFNLPNLMNKTVWGGGLSAVGGEKAAGLPNLVSGTVSTADIGENETVGGGPITITTVVTPATKIPYLGDGTIHDIRWKFDASRGNSIYGASDTVQPPALVLLPCIKAFEAVVNGGMVDVGELIKSIDALKDIAGGSSNEITNIVQNLGNYLPLAGGTMTGSIKRNGYVASGVSDDGVVSMTGAVSGNEGSALALYGPEHADKPGTFSLAASDGSSRTYLVGEPDGKLTWGGRKLLTEVQPDNANQVHISAGHSNLVADNPGAMLYLFGAGKDPNTWGVPGAFMLYAVRDGASAVLTGHADGSLTWQGQHVLRAVAVGGDYVRYSDGTQICWGSSSTTANKDTTVAFPIAFAQTPYVVIGRSSEASTTGVYTVWQRAATASNFKVFSTGTTGTRWVALGRWY